MSDESQKQFAESEESLFVIPSQSRKFETWKELEAFLEEQIATKDLISKIICGGNSYSREACEYIAEIIKTKGDLEKFYYADFSNMFVSRKLDELPDSVSLLIDAVKGFNITHLYMSDNAFGPNGVVRFNE